MGLSIEANLNGLHLLLNDLRHRAQVSTIYVCICIFHHGVSHTYSPVCLLTGKCGVALINKIVEAFRLHSGDNIIRIRTIPPPLANCSRWSPRLSDPRRT